MKSRIIISTILVSLFLFSCGKKKYEDYNEEDFIEKQGIITKMTRTSNPLDSEWNRDIIYAYNLEEESVSYGQENNIDLMFKLGQPIVILVHKDDDKISFYARRGLINEQEWAAGFKRLIDKK
ncbi:hypothetical protein [Tenacibaculum sp. 47A_GOM-205m]|uniref:hypothetical protein n=1 Tax=Tenacibaculum sp. 47A_GOM-205m TaxID=1380384 RepID=UPI0012DD2FF2|nr:hypothetical protein [Tenacibaculum sp. 47A_GOM-205m]